MHTVKKPFAKQITAKINIFNDWLEVRIRKNDELLHRTRIDDLIAENTAYLEQLLRR